MSEIKIIMCPASDGDSFLISINHKKPINILIDTGLKTTYKTYLKSKLEALHRQKETLSLLIITHIDSDHISGALSLLEENSDNESNKIIAIQNIWHNSYRHIQFDDNQSIRPDCKERNRQIIKRIEANGYKSNEKEATQDVLKNISAQQGSSLASLIRQGQYSWNMHFNGKAVCIEHQQKVKFSGDVEIILLSPNLEKLTTLKEKWRSILIGMGFIGKGQEDLFFDDAFEFQLSREKTIIKNQRVNISCSVDNIEALASKDFIEDKSNTNGSSISFILKHRSRQFLFLGDSYPSLIEQSLGELYKNEKSIWFDAIKIAHHGSKHNTSPNLLKLIDSDCYFISTNGIRNKDHPDLETLARIIHRPTQKARKIFFNYKNKAYDFLNNQKIMSEYNYTVNITQEMQEFVF